jgi:tetratricopeptide (TPR) repeat protein
MGGRLPLPTTVRDAIARRLARLSDVAQEAVGAAVALGNTFDPVLLSAATERPVEASVDAVEELLSRRLVRMSSPPRTGYEFAHESIRRVARDVFPPGWHGTAQHGDTRTTPAGRTPPDAGATHRKRRRRIRRWSVLTASIAVLGITAAIYRLHNPPQAATPVLAIGSVRAYGGADTSGTASAIADMLATNLSRVPSVRVVSPARMYELLGRLGGVGDGKAAMALAARQAGATELVEGALYRRERGGLRLDLRRVDLATGDVKQAYAAEGTDAFTLVDRATSELAAALGAPTEQLRIADVTTRSLAAYRLYQEGLRAYYRSADFAGADRLFTAALAEDSTFAMTAYYAYLMELASGVPGGWHHLAIAARMADRASDRERLLIRTTWTSEEGNPAYVAVAETLVTRYPTEPEGYLILGRALSGRGDVVGAIKMFRHVLAMDTLPLESSSARCLACEAMFGIVDSYWWADSLPAAERAAREWVRRQPAAAAAWSNLSARLGSQGKYPEALAALRTASRLAPAEVDDVNLRAELSLTVGDFAEADRLFRDRIRNGAPASRDRAAWDLDISFRNQGRLRDALALAGGNLSQADNDGPTLVTAPLPELVRAQVLFEMGRTREAATLFQSIAASPLDSMPAGRIARHGSWYLTHAATALAAAGDTGRLAALADTIQKIGARSTYGRDPLLYHHVRGLLLAARRKPDDAVAEFRRAIYSPTLGFTRTNLELGRGLIALGRPREAIASLAPALRGGLEGSNLYVTRTELHEMLARAFDAASDPDSATVHYQAVVSAWRRADPQFRARYDAARLRLAQLTALRATPRADRL